jgi:hypothetical protein
MGATCTRARSFDRAGAEASGLAAMGRVRLLGLALVRPLTACTGGAGGNRIGAIGSRRCYTGAVLPLAGGAVWVIGLNGLAGRWLGLADGVELRLFVRPAGLLMIFLGLGRLRVGFGHGIAFCLL